jgi:hypothetical protein
MADQLSDQATRIVFDPREWERTGYDQPDGNARFWHEATILRTYLERPWGGRRELLADVRFSHDGRESRGHIVSMMRDVPLAFDEVTR